MIFTLIQYIPRQNIIVMLSIRPSYLLSENKGAVTISQSLSALIQMTELAFLIWQKQSTFKRITEASHTRYKSRQVQQEIAKIQAINRQVEYTKLIY